MNINKKVLLVTAIVLINSVVCYSQDIASDFDQALAMVPGQPASPSGIMYYDMQDAAGMFVSKYSGTSAVEFLQTKIEHPESRKLALFCLAKLGATDKIAENALYEVIYEQDRRAMITIAYLDPNDGRRIAETLFLNPGPAGLRKAAANMLIGLGDQSTLEIFKQMKAFEKNSIVKKGLESAIPRLEYRLTKVPPDKQAEWGRQEILSWRTLGETPLPRKVGGENGLAAQTLYMQGWRFSQDFLEYKLNVGDLIAVAIIGYQKEAWAVEGLRNYATLNSSLGAFARGSLAEIGTYEALRALEESLIPGGHSRVNRHLTILLQICGDQASAEFLKNLSVDERFSQRERAYMKAASKFIEKRIKKKSWEQGGSGTVWKPGPADGTESVAINSVLSWSAGSYAVAHDVYFGTDFNSVNDATTSSSVYKGTQPLDASSYFPGPLKPSETYYWRIDEVNDANANSPWKGPVWRFTARNYIPSCCITATGSSEYKRGFNTVNGSGLYKSDGQWFHTNDLNAENMWLTADITISANPTGHVGPAWIKYEFDRVYRLGAMWVWNFNQYSPVFPSLTGRGLRNVTIEYSINGTNYTKLGEYEFAQAAGMETYAHNTEVDFGGVEARYVVITTNTIAGNWGDPYSRRYGLSEVRFYEFNHIPVADAGPDRKVYAWIDGIAEVTLDGTGSYDDDGQPLTYLWSWTIDGQTYDVNGVTPTIELPVGEQTIELIVNDGIDDSEPDEVVITVIEPLESHLWISPQVINRYSRQPKIFALLRLPEGVTRDQIDSDQPLVLYPAGSEAIRRYVIQYRRRRAQQTSIFALFDKAELMDAVSTNGSVELQVVGQLKTGQYFYGTDTVRIISPRNDNNGNGRPRRRGNRR